MLMRARVCLKYLLSGLKNSRGISLRSKSLEHYEMEEFLNNLFVLDNLLFITLIFKLNYSISQFAI
jgi:hypothetical protein